MILMKFHALFLKKQQNLKLSSAANYRVYTAALGMAKVTVILAKIAV